MMNFYNATANSSKQIDGVIDLGPVDSLAMIISREQYLTVYILLRTYVADVHCAVHERRKPESMR